ncbi:TRAP transporter substrate-binding protein DctP [uncultured Mailhella sp.]|uniref:TRAP transporter substrate-binding protein DctP n=1 Tax=uncultured Mailhella sp. TaxID=1981031 RepID=UPI0025DFC57A|nr:TRAP transporter substrate-binding protein DctP [uncultured Mailhella sp.]
MRKVLLSALGMAAMLGTPQYAPAAEYDLSFNLPVTSTNSQWTEFLKPWVEELEKRSGGRIHIEPYFAGALSPMSECFNTVKEGLADFTETVLGNSHGQFPYHERTWEVADPALALTQGTSIMRTIQKEFPQVMDEFSGAKLLFTYDMNSEHVIGTKKPVTRLSDFKGLKIATWGGPITSERIKALDAVPVPMAPPDIYMALQSGIVDGVLTNSSMLISWRYADMIKHLTCINMLGASVFGAMSQDTYDNLPDDLKKVIDDMCGQFTDDLFDKYRQFELMYIKEWKEKYGGQLHLLTAEEYEEVRRRFEPADKAWVAALNEAGLPGQKIYDRIRELQRSTEVGWNDSPYVKLIGIN